MDTQHCHISSQFVCSQICQIWLYLHIWIQPNFGYKYDYDGYSQKEYNKTSKPVKNKFNWMSGCKVIVKTKIWKFSLIKLK